MRIFSLALAVSALALSACTTTNTAGGGSGGADAPPAAGAATPTDRAGYVTQAAASDLYEIQSSQIAQSKAQRPEVREFAQMLITHHTQTTAALTAAARASGMTPPPPALTPMHREMIEQLQTAAAAGFDELYLGQQVPAHEMALALHQTYASDGDTPALRTAATAAVPIIQQHLTRARELNR
jgi:putative membrane protein